jgi:hypothetical protein
MLWNGFRIDTPDNMLALRDQTVEILLKEFKFIEIFGINDINAIISIIELNN